MGPPIECNFLKKTIFLFCIILKFKKQSDWAKKVLPKEFSDGNTLSDAPSNIIVAYRIFEQTFEKRLNKVFKI